MNPLMTTGLSATRSSATALSVNLNLVAMMRNRRALGIPSVTRAATIVLEAGAAGFVTKSSLSDELLHAVQQVMQGNVYLPPELTSELGALQGLAGHSKPPLTQRQELVLRCLLDGLSNRDIAEMLHVSEETVKTHVTAILRHFDVQNRTQAVVAAARVGYRPMTRN